MVTEDFKGRERKKHSHQSMGRMDWRRKRWLRNHNSDREKRKGRTQGFERMGTLAKQLAAEIWVEYTVPH